MFWWFGLGAKSCSTLATPWTVARQAPLPMGFSRQGYWNGLPFPSPGDLPDPGIEPGSPALQEESLPTELRGKQNVWVWNRVAGVERKGQKGVNVIAWIIGVL